MNDPKRNELLSAYLDGELTAAEQAEVERLLDGDPSARQLLDELRALSVALQSLPRETLGEDLSEKVLRAAERRVLLEGVPKSDEENAAVPLSRAVAARVFNARVIAYAGITIALATVIVLLDNHQGQAPVADRGNEIAFNEAEHLELDRQPEAEEPGYPPQTQATRDSVAESVRQPEMERGPAMKAAPLPKARLFSGKSLKGAAPPPPTLGFSDQSGADAPPTGRKPAMPRPRGGEDMLVVQCDVTPEAFANKDFDKLLASNGITRRRQFNAAEPPAPGKSADGDIEGNLATPENLISGRNSVQNLSPLDSENVNLVYVEATPEQIEAMLSAIGATKNNAFSNVMVSPSRGRLDTTRLKAGQAVAAGGGLGGLKEADKEVHAQKAPSRSIVPPPSSAARGGTGTFGAPPPNDATESQKARPRSDTDWQAGEGDQTTESGEREKSTDKKQEEKDDAKPDGDGHTAIQRQEAQSPAFAATANSRRVLFVLRIVPAEPDTRASSSPAKAQSQPPMASAEKNEPESPPAEAEKK